MLADKHLGFLACLEAEGRRETEQEGMSGVGIQNNEEGQEQVQVAGALEEIVGCRLCQSCLA